MFSHFTQGSNDLEVSAEFYDALLEPLGIVRTEDVNNEIICYQSNKAVQPKFFVVSPYDDGTATAGNGSMIAFTASSRAEVDASFEAGCNYGGTDEGPPGNRPHYSDGYYGAYLRDPEGNKVHVVYRGDLENS